VNAVPATLMNAVPAIRAAHLHKTYPSADGADVVALQNVSFDIADGEFVSLVGPSGCGKSTLLKIMAGLLPHTSGDIQIAGHAVSGPSPDIGMVFQAPVLLPWRTILQNVLLSSEMRATPGIDYRERAEALLAMVGLADFSARYPHELSGGMQQRASIVRALVQDPRILLMDEPFGALDAMTREQMNVEVLRIWQTTRKTVVFVTHSISESVFLSDRVFVMTPRPGALATIIDIDLPRPRSLGLINSERFGTFVAQIRDLLHAKEDLSA
jgi:NitT/TauT family transport system ATP-binding protein